MTEDEFLRNCYPELVDAFSCLFLGDDPTSTLSKEEQELILVGVYAALGSEGKVAEHGKKALEAGASPGAIVEAVLAATMSRGERALGTAQYFISELPVSEGCVERQSKAGESPLEYFESQFGVLPGWVHQLWAFSPDSLASYAVLRSRILTDAAMSRKAKELLTMLLNAVTGNAGGIKAHASAAMQYGADKKEILSVLLLGVRVGGIVVWINGVNALSGLTE